MRHYRLKIIAATGCIVAFFLMLGVIGDFDYCEQVILHMSQEQYDWVKDSLTKRDGKKPTERQIAHWWAEHHSDYP